MRFVPAANKGHISAFSEILTKEITGTVVQVHEAHRWYRVRFTYGERPVCIGFECFKF